jgi:hypothetical protein
MAGHPLTFDQAGVDIESMTGCGAAIARKIDECECHLPPGHPAPHRCDDCGLAWYEYGTRIDHERNVERQT